MSGDAGPPAQALPRTPSRPVGRQVLAPVEAVAIPVATPQWQSGDLGRQVSLARDGAAAWFGGEKRNGSTVCVGWMCAHSDPAAGPCPAPLGSSAST